MPHPPWRRWLNVILWLAALGWLAVLFVRATDEKQQLWRSADVAWQWMMGHALVHGELHDLYTVAAGERWLAQGYAPGEVPEMVRKLLRKGREQQPMPDGIDGPLYPPTASFVVAWQGLVTARQAHQLSIIFQGGCTLLAAWILSLLLQGRLTSGEVLTLLCLLPHHYAGMTLGQNHPFSLLLLVLGWWNLQRGRPLVAGLVWGGFIYKPVILAVLFLVPVVQRQWRLPAGMVVTAIVLCLATVPFTGGLKPWERWVTVGQRASIIYELDRRWIWMSRDVSGLPRRAMWTPEEWQTQWHLAWQADPASPQFMATNLETLPSGRVQTTEKARLLGWVMLCIILCVGCYFCWKTDSVVRDPLLLLTLCLAIPRFMFYDLFLVALPMLLLVGRWSQLRGWLQVAVGLVVAVLLASVVNFLRAPSFALQTVPFELLALLLCWCCLVVAQAFPWLSQPFWYPAHSATP
jgi:hypothetical protein